MTKGLTVAAAVLMLAAGGAVEIARSGRSASDAQVADARDRLNALPMAVGDWKAREQPPNPKELEQAKADAYVSRVYIREKTKDAVTVLIMAGNPKEMGAHDPKVCYVSAGYNQKGVETKVAVERADGKSDTFWSTKFESDRLSPPLQQVMWAWCAGGADGVWTASGQPRIEFARESLLYKVYVSRALGRPTTEESGKEKVNPTTELLTVLLPEVRKTLAPDGK